MQELLKNIGKYAIAAGIGAALTFEFLHDNQPKQAGLQSNLTNKSHRNNSAILWLNNSGYETGIPEGGGGYWYWTAIYKKCRMEKVPVGYFSTPLQEEPVFERSKLEKCATESDWREVERILGNHGYKPRQYKAQY